MTEETDVLTSFSSDTTCIVCDKRFELGQQVEVVLNTTIAYTVDLGDRLAADAVHTKAEVIHEQCFEDMKDALGTVRKVRLLTDLRTTYGIHADMCQEYINEAEHQDGITYWLQFQTAEELRTDMHHYYNPKE